MIFLMSHLCGLSNVYPKVDDCAGTITQVVQHDFKSRDCLKHTMVLLYTVHGKCHNEAFPMLEICVT